MSLQILTASRIYLNHLSWWISMILWLLKCWQQPLVLQHPCHNQAVERHVKLVTEVVSVVTRYENRDGMICRNIQSRLLMSNLTQNNNLFKTTLLPIGLIVTVTQTKTVKCGVRFDCVIVKTILYQHWFACNYAELSYVVIFNLLTAILCIRDWEHQVIPIPHNSSSDNAINTLRAEGTIYSYFEIGLKPAVVTCLTNAIAPLSIALESCSRAQTDQPVI